MTDTPNALYWMFENLAHKILDDLKGQNLVFVGIFRDGIYQEGRVTDKNNIARPFQVMYIEEILAVPLALNTLLGYAYREAREEYIDNSTR